MITRQLALALGLCLTLSAPAIATGAEQGPGQLGSPGKGGSRGAGGGGQTLPAPDTWPASGRMSDRGDSNRDPELLTSSADPLLPDPSSLELSQEKAEEAQFLRSLQENDASSDFDLSLDFYQDPLKSLEYNLNVSLGEIDLSSFDLPIQLNDEVIAWLQFYLGRGRTFIRAGLARSTRHVPMMEQIFAEAGIPRDLIYVGLIESGFSTAATSPMQAAGIWQLMAPTARAYGLRIDGQVDERRDPERSTRAAGRHLRDLHEKFGDWYLAAAAYNAGVGRIGKAVERTHAGDFWTLASSGQLRDETRHYVPKLVAAAIIAQNPERFGFRDIAYEPALEVTAVTVDGSTDLEVVASRLGIKVSDLSRLNPGLRGLRTPAGNYELNVPSELAAEARDAFRDLSVEERLVYRQHRVQSGENLGTIARRYDVSQAELMKMNRMSSSRLRAGQMLMVPQGTAVTETVVVNALPAEAETAVATRTAKPAPSSARYKVQSGDNMWSIARRYDVSVADLQRWNGLKTSANLQVGMVLTVSPNR